MTPPHSARACRVHDPRRPFMARLAASSQLPAVHCCRRRHPARRLARDIACFRLSLPQKNMQQAALALFVASVLESRLRTKPLGGFHAASQVLMRSYAHRVVPSLTRSRNWRAIAGRSCFALRFCHVRRKACVAAPSMMCPAQQRVAHCVDDCFRMNTP